MVTWEGVREAHADCSGFIDMLLQHSYGYTPYDFKLWFDSHRPSAKRYHDAISAGKGFDEIKNVREVQPGDFLAVKYFTGAENTGHVMLVSAAPQITDQKAPLVAGTEQWAVPVIDSSESGHGPADTRHHKGLGGKDQDGVGTGVLRVYCIPGGGGIVGFTWSTLAISEFKTPDKEHLVAGRLKPGYKP